MVYTIHLCVNRLSSFFFAYKNFMWMTCMILSAPFYSRGYEGQRWN